jgi:hypothetical protein
MPMAHLQVSPANPEDPTHQWAMGQGQLESHLLPCSAPIVPLLLEKRPIIMPPLTQEVRCPPSVLAPFFVNRRVVRFVCLIDSCATSPAQTASARWCWSTCMPHRSVLALRGCSRDLDSLSLLSLGLLRVGL